MKIAVNGGHGPNTPGKRTPDGVKEFEFNYPTARYLEQYLQEYEGVQTLFIPEPNRDVPLTERTDRANAWGADMWLSVHYNAYKTYWTDANGVETWVYKTRPKESTSLAEVVQAALVKATGRRDRGVKAGNLHEVRETKCTAILCECGFMDNRQEAATMKDPEFQKLIARTIADAVAKFYGLKKKNGEYHKPKPSPVVRDEYEAAQKQPRLLRVGTRGDDVEDLQSTLKHRGYNVGPIDGIFGERTQAAVRQFQSDAGISVDGIVGDKTRKALTTMAKYPGHYIHLKRPYMRGKYVKAVQRKVGVKVDGVFGPISARGVRTWQRSNDLAPDSIVGPKTWKKMFD